VSCCTIADLCLIKFKVWQFSDKKLLFVVIALTWFCLSKGLSSLSTVGSMVISLSFLMRRGLRLVCLVSWGVQLGEVANCQHFLDAKGAGFNLFLFLGEPINKLCDVCDVTLDIAQDSFAHEMAAHDDVELC